MAWTDAETSRINTLEEALNDLATAINHLASKQQLRQLLLIKQTTIDALTLRVASLEAQIATLQSEQD